MMSDFSPPSTDSDQACGSLMWRVVMPSFATAPIEGKRKIAIGHAAPIVGNPDPPPAAAIGENVDPAGAGVDGVFHQFLDHARRTLADPAGGNAVDDLFGQLADGHGR